MSGLLDHIFSNLEERKLDKQQIIDYVQYLDEIILGGLPLQKELEYQAIKLKLIGRLNTLNKEQIQFYLSSKENKGKKDNG